MASHARLHAELIGLLRQHSPFLDQRHLVLLAQMVTGLLLSQTVCFDRWKSVLPLGNCLAASWQRRCQRWLLWNRCCVVVLSVVAHGRAIPLLWHTLASASAASSGLRDPQRIDRLLLIVAIAVMGSLQGYAISLTGLRRQVDPHWRQGRRFVRIGLATLQVFVADIKVKLMTWMPIPQRQLGPCIPSRGVRLAPAQAALVHAD